MKLKNTSVFALMLSIIISSQSLIIPVSAEDIQTEGVQEEELQETQEYQPDPEKVQTEGVQKEELQETQEYQPDPKKVQTEGMQKEELKETQEYQPDPEENNTYSFGGISTSREPNYNLNSKATLSEKAIGSGSVNTPNLNIRSGPSTSHSVLGTLKSGETVEIYARSNNWYRIYYGGQYGYVSSSYINLNYFEKGIDVSYHNGTIDWKEVKASGIDYAIIRAGYGTSTVDTMFHTNIKGAIEAGLKIGVYWFSYATSPEKAKIEAEKCLEVISPYKNSIVYPVFYDFEYASVDYAEKQGVTVTKTLATEMANSFIDTVKEQGYDTGLYTNLDFSSNYFTKDILYSNNIWIAQYNTVCSYKNPYMMWQYSESGNVDGINGNVDLNYTSLKSIKHDYNGNDKPNSNLNEVQKVYNVKVSSRTSTSLNLSWSKVNGATGYIVQRYDSSSDTYKTIVTLSGESKTSYNVTNLNGGATYKYKVKAYKKVDNNTYYGPASNEVKGVTNPYTAKNLKVDWTSTTSVKLSWSKQAEATGYKVYRYDPNSDTYTRIATIDGNYNTNYTDSNLYTANGYKYKVKSYVKADSEEYMGGDSNIVSAITKPSTPVVNLKSYTGKIGIVWTNIQKSTGYQLYMSTSKDGKYSLINTISSTTYTKTGLTKGKTYYFKVVPYKTIGGKTVYGSGSTVKSIKCN